MALACACAFGGASAHEAGAPFSAAIVDPLVLHHAHIEDEQRLNLFSVRRLRDGATSGRNAFETELELGWSNSRFDFGMEAFVPLARQPSPDGAGNVTGIGDIEVRPVKYALVNRPELVVSTALGIGLPTGDRARGLGNGNTTLTQYLFVDKAWGNWYGGLNLSLDRRVRGEEGSGYGYGIVASYSFLAAGVPVVSPSLELIGSRRWSGPDAGERGVSRVLGITLWWPRSGWQFHLGMQTAVSGASEADRTYLLQLGNHQDWDRLF